MPMTFDIEELTYVRAGSDYFPACWTAHVTASSFGVRFLPGDKFAVRIKGKPAYTAFVLAIETINREKCYWICDDNDSIVFGH